MSRPTRNNVDQLQPLNLIVLFGLLSGSLLTVLLWLSVSVRVIRPLFWVCLGGVALLGAMSLRRLRWLPVLAALAAVSLVYLFPELLGPACGGIPAALAQDPCRVCTRHEKYWDFYGKLKKRCAEWRNICSAPDIDGSLNCSQWGQANWCAGSLWLDLSATQATGNEVLISGDVDGVPFACPVGAGSANCSIPLPKGSGTANYSATSVEGSVSGFVAYQRDSTQPQINGTLTGTSGNNGWYVSIVDVNATASDPGPGSNIAAFDYNLNNTGWASFPGTLSLPDGAHSLSLQAVDAAGNFIQSDQLIQVDTLAPTVNVSIAGAAGVGGWYNSAVSVSALGSDSGSGVFGLEYSLNGGAYAPYTGPLTFGDGVHSYQFRVTDMSGNSAESSLGQLAVDATPPRVELPASWELGYIVGFKLQDDGSGLAQLRLVIEDEHERYPKLSWQEELSGHKYKGEIDWNGRFKGGILALPGGEYYAFLKVSDNAGNERIQAGQIIVPFAVIPQGAAPADTVSPITLAPVPTQPPEITGAMPPPAIPEPTGDASQQQVPASGGSSLQPSSVQVGKVSFSAGGNTSVPTASSQSNVLWGATATAAIGAFAAEIARRRQEEAAARAAQAAAWQEARAASNYRQQIRAKKLGKLEAKWNQVKQAAQERTQTARKRVLGLKEQQLLDPKIPPSPPKPGYVPPDMSWKRDDIRAAEQVQQERDDPDRLLREQEAGIEWSTRVIAEPYVNPEINNYMPDPTESEIPLWEMYKRWIKPRIEPFVYNPPAWLSLSVQPKEPFSLFNSTIDELVTYQPWARGGDLPRSVGYQHVSVSLEANGKLTSNPDGRLDINFSNGRFTFKGIKDRAGNRKDWFVQPLALSFGSVESSPLENIENGWRVSVSTVDIDIIGKNWASFKVSQGTGLKYTETKETPKGEFEETITNLAKVDIGVHRYPRLVVLAGAAVLVFKVGIALAPVFIPLIPVLERVGAWLKIPLDAFPQFLFEVN